MAKKGKSKKKLEVLHLVCEETGDYNYTIRRKTGGEKLKVKKYSPRLRKHTIHNENNDRQTKRNIQTSINMDNQKTTVQRGNWSHRYDFQYQY